MVSRKGFTLIELLVVIAIISLLVSMIFVTVNESRAKARDAKRISDIGQVNKALEMRVTDTTEYPRSVPPGPPWNESCSDPTNWVPDVVSENYIRVLPIDPVNSSDICYRYRSNSSEFKLAVYFESQDYRNLYAATDGGRKDDWYEIFTPGGDWNW